VYASGITKNRQYGGKIGERRARVKRRLDARMAWQKTRKPHGVRLDRIQSTKF
jgi:hypothetical protein